MFVFTLSDILFVVFFVIILLGIFIDWIIHRKDDD